MVVYGIETDVISVLPSKAELPILITSEGIMTFPEQVLPSISIELTITQGLLLC